MDDIMGKIGELLSDEESVKQLSEIAQMLMSETNSSAEEKNSAETSTSEEKKPEEGIGNGMPDIGSLMKLTGLIGAFSQTDKNSELLLALRPHLREEKQKKIDKAIKLLKLIAIWNIAKESGLLQDFI